MDSPRQTITLSAAAWAAIVHHAASAFPDESCGVLIGLASPQPHHEPRLHDEPQLHDEPRLQGAVIGRPTLPSNRERRERVSAITDAASSFNVHSSHPCPNRAPHSRHNSFLIDPEDILAIRRLALDSGLDLIGFYHSHPNAPAYLSPRDLRQCWPGYPNLVVSISSGQPITARAFIASSDQTNATEIPLLIDPALKPSSATPPS